MPPNSPGSRKQASRARRNSLVSVMKTASFFVRFSARAEIGDAIQCDKRPSS
jgi:hypothetical protein